MCHCERNAVERSPAEVRRGFVVNVGLLAMTQQCTGKYSCDRFCNLLLFLDGLVGFLGLDGGEKFFEFGGGEFLQVGLGV